MKDKKWPTLEQKTVRQRCDERSSAKKKPKIAKMKSLKIRRPPKVKKNTNIVVNSKGTPTNPTKRTAIHPLPLNHEVKPTELRSALILR